MRKLIEKENQAARDKEMKAYNDLVRKLAKHVKYYDPRCKEQLRKETLQREEQVRIFLITHLSCPHFQARLAEIAKKEKQEMYKKMKEEYEREKALEYAQNPSSSSEESEGTIEID